ncbi:AUGMIN subunit 8, partial [Cucurbita argyrosperma subsp. sororia]
MDIFESDSIRNHSTGETPRLPLGLAERSNVLATRRSRTREVSSRYKSPIPSAPSSPRRCQSPSASRTLSASSQLEQKRALSAERKRPSTPTSPTSPSTSDHDLSSDLRLSSRRTAGGRSAESLWPSTMRSLNVSFHSDIISIPVSKKEKPVPASPSDRTLRPSSNFAHKLVETPMVSRKPTPERKRSPLKGKNVPDQLENSKPIDGLHTRLIDQRRASRIGRKISLNALSRSGDFTDKIIRSSPGPLPGIGLPSLRRTSSDSINKLLPRSNNDSSKILPLDDGLRMEDGTNSVDDCSLQAPGIGRKISLNALSRSGDHTDKIIRSSPRPLSGIGLPSLRRTSSDSINKLLPRSNNDSSGILPLDDGLRMEEGTNSVDNGSLRTSGIGRKISLNALSRSVDHTDKIIRSSPGSLPLRRTSSDSINKLLPRSNNDSSRILPLDDGIRMEDGTNSVGDCSLQTSRIGKKISLNALSRCVDHTDKIIRNSTGPLPGIGSPSLRRTSSDSINKLLPRSNNDSSKILPLEDGLRMEDGTNSVDDGSFHASGIGKKISLNTLSRSVDHNDKIIRSSLGPLPGIGLPSLRRTSSDSINKLLPRSNNDSSKILPLDDGLRMEDGTNSVDGLRMEDGTNSVDDCSLQASGIGRKISLNALSRSVDHTDKIMRSSSRPLPLRRTSSDSINKLLPRSNNDSSRILPLDDGLRMEDGTNSVDDCSLQASEIGRKISLNALSRSVDHTDKIIQSSPGPLRLRRTSSDSINKLLPRSNNDSSRILPLDDDLKMEDGTNSVDDCSLQASEIGRKISLNALSRSVDLTDKIIRSSPGPLPLRRTSSDSINKLLPRSNNDSSRILPLDDGLRMEDGTNSVDDCSLQASEIGRKISLNALSQSVDHTDKIIRSSPGPLRLRRSSSDSINKLLPRSNNDSSRILPLDDGLRMEDGTNSVDDCSLQALGIGRKISLNALSQSMDHTDKIIQSLPEPLPRIRLPSSRRTSSNPINKLLQRSDNDSSRILPLDDGLRMEDGTNSVDDCSLQASGVGRKISLNASSRSMDHTDKIIRSSLGPLPGIGLPSSRRTSSDSINKLLQRSDNDSSRILPLDDGLRMEDETNSVDDCSLQASGIGRKISLNALSRSVDLTDKIIHSSPGPPPEIGLPSLKRTSSDSINKLLQRSDNDSSKILPLDDDLRMEDETNSVDDGSLQASGIGRKISLNALSQSVDLTDKIIRSSPRLHPGIGLPSLRSSSDSINKLLISDNDSSRIIPLNNGLNDGLRMEDETNIVDDCSLQTPGTPRLASNGLPDRLKSTPAVRSQSLTLPGLRLPSPIRTSVPSSSVSRGSSPARPRPSTPPPRGVSPSRIRPTNSIQSNSSTSVLSFIADFKGKKGANHIEDSHQLRLLYNRYMQWRFSNARAEAIHDMHKVDAERTLCNVWKAMIRIWDSVTRNRIDLHMLKLELKLNEIMNDQMSYLDEWDSLERDHINSLSGVSLDLKANTLRVPLTAGATADVESLKGAIGSALNVMRVMASSICSLLSQVERMNGLASELAAVASQEKAMLDECESLLASTTAMQVEEHSLRTHLIQMKQSSENTTLNLLPHKYNYHTTFITPRQRS